MYIPKIKKSVFKIELSESETNKLIILLLPIKTKIWSKEF